MAVPAGVHAGVIGVAPSRELFERARAREAALAAARREPRSDPELACAARRPPTGLRTYPPRENGGNMDMRDLVPGAGSGCPCTCPGALLSVGDLHFAQGDGEVCISAIETGGSATVPGRPARATAGGRAFPAARRRRGPARAMFATTGIPLADDGAQRAPRPEPRHPARAARDARLARGTSTASSASPPTC